MRWPLRWLANVAAFVFIAGVLALVTLLTDAIEAIALAGFAVIGALAARAVAARFRPPPG